MDLALVQKEVSNWTPEEQDQLAAHLAVLRLQRTADHDQELSRRLNDRAPESWLTLEEVQKSLDEDREPE